MEPSISKELSKLSPEQRVLAEIRVQAKEREEAGRQYDRDAAENKRKKSADSAQALWDAIFAFMERAEQVDYKDPMVAVGQLLVGDYIPAKRTWYGKRIPAVISTTTMLMYFVAVDSVHTIDITRTGQFVQVLEEKGEGRPVEIKVSVPDFKYPQSVYKVIEFWDVVERVSKVVLKEGLDRLCVIR